MSSICGGRSGLVMMRDALGAAAFVAALILAYSVMELI